ncbi:hypothetical protein HDU77_000540 [Chytriomyces hyalinus]|nr:hypothetical protein HDU77_000540 [Chytriomyces hyalinus]
MLKTSRFVARYIRDASRNTEKRTRIMDLLHNDQPFDEETVGAVALIDISGFTALTSTLLAQQGRRSSEEMTQAVSKFMSKIIDIISYYGGDVIKFLGDALLIVFEAKSASTEDLQYTTRRALICCTEVLIKGKTKSVQTSRSAASPSKKKTFEVDEDLLDLHIGLSAGAFHHVIVGVAGQRCDYFVHGPPLGEIGGALDNARPGELGIARSAVEVLELPESIYSQIKIRKYEQKGNSVTVEFKSLEILQTQLALLEPARLDFLHEPRREASGVGHSGDSAAVIEEVRLADAFSFQFMNQSLVHKVKNLMNSDRLNGDNKNQTISITSNNGAGTHSQVGKDDDDDLAPSKYGPSSEYRRVTIMFIKFRFSYTKMRAHQLFSVLIQGLMPYDGVTQQFSVDDKGQSFFAVFGLPPWSHENNAVFAVRAAITVSDMLKANGLTPFTIGLSTGDLLFSHMGSSIRSEAGLLGDVVNVAARLMIFNKAEGYNIFCDYDTHEATTELYQHAEIGLHMLKGKLEPVSIWAIKNSKLGLDNLKVNHKDKRNFGYTEEKAKVNTIFSKWMVDGCQSVLIVEGPSGMGKTSLMDNALVSMNKHDAKIVIIRGTEIERNTPLFPIKSLMRSLFRIFGQMSELEKAELASANQGVLFPNSIDAVIPEIKIDGSPDIIYAGGSNSPTPAPMPSPALSTKKTGTRRKPSKQVVNAALAQVDESPEAIKNFVTACGENAEYIPILQSVMDWVDKKDTDATKDMTADERRDKLRSMILHIIKAMTECLKIAVLCDDLQFMDVNTLELLCTIIQTTTKTLFFLFSRPFTIYKLNSIENLKYMACTTHLQLNGLSVLDTQKMLVWKFRDIGATSIDKELLRVIHLRSSGSPFFLDKLADTLLATLPRVISCDERGVVISSASDIDYQEILAINVESAILVTFDQLDHHFQELLRVASVCGMYFDFYDVSAVIDGNYPPDDLIAMAQSLDMFSFLTPCPIPPPNFQVQEIIPEERKKYRYCFTHMLISNTIYGSQPFGHRQEIHRRIANYLEEKLTPENRSSILPSIAFHYSNTSEQDKMYIYFEMLGLEYVDRFLFPEGIAALGKLIHMFEAEKKTDAGSTMAPMRQAIWYSALAYAETGRKSIQNARKNALKALSLLDANWPETEEQYNLILKQNNRKHNMLWLRTIGGRLSTGNANPEKDKIIFRCLSVLHCLAIMDPTLPQKDIPLTNTQSLNLAIAHGEVYRPEFVHSCFKTAEWQWLANNKYLSNLYLQQGKKLSVGYAAYESFLNAQATLLAHKGDFAAALASLELGAKNAKEAKNKAAFHMNQVFVSITLLTTGKLNESYEAALENCKEVESNDEHLATLLYCIPLAVISVFTDKMEDATKWTTMVTAKADYSAQVLSKVFCGVACLFHMRKGDHSKALDKFQDMINSGMVLMSAGQRMPLHLFAYCSIFPFLYHSLEKDPDPKKVQGLIETLNTAVNVARKLYLNPSVEGAAAYRMYLAAQLLLQGKPDLGLSVITKALSTKPTSTHLASMKLHHGLQLAVAGRFCTNASQKAQYAEKASTVLIEIGAQGLADWAKGGEYKFV